MSKRKNRWSADRLAGFSRHLSGLLQAGFPLVPSLRLLSEQEVIRGAEAGRILRQLDGGISFSEALAKEGLPPLFISLLRAAEEYGDYGHGLQQCEQYYAEKDRLIRELTRTLTYPAVVFLLVVLAFLFLMTTVVPRFSDMYETMGLTLPVYTQLFISFHESLRIVFLVVGMAFLLAVVAIMIIRRLPSDRRNRWTAPLYRLPVVRSYFALRFTHYLAVQLGSLLRAGLPLLKAVEVINELIPWPPLKTGMVRIRERLLAGEPLHRALKREGPLFLLSLNRMVALGEESGELDQALLSLAKGTEMMMKERLDRFTRSLEPILIFVIGLMMAMTVLALFLPMLNLVRAI